MEPLHTHWRHHPRGAGRELAGVLPAVRILAVRILAVRILTARLPAVRLPAVRLPAVRLLVAALVAALGLAAAPASAAARDYALDADASQLRLRLLRTGPFAALAHDHILVAKGLAGRIAFSREALSSSTGQLSVPIAFLEVDDPKERAQEGFAGELSESNRASIRENMLAADQLDVANFPRVTVTVERVDGELPNPRLRVRLKIRDREQALTIPATVSADSGTLIVSGEVELLQSAFGIAPYSSLFGAIAVQDAVRVKFQIVARAE